MKVKIIDFFLKQLHYGKENSAKVWCLCLLIGVTILIPSEQLFAQTAPVVQSITRYNPVSSTVNNPSQVTFRVQFSQGVTNVDATDFDITGSVDATLSSVTTVNDSLYEVKLENIVGTGFLGLGVKGTGSIAGTNDIGSYTTSGTELLTIEQDQANDYLNHSEIGQTFTATTSTVLHKITIYKNSGNHFFSGTATLTIYSGEYGGGSATSLTSELVTFTSDAGAQSFELTDKPDLVSGEKYSFVFSNFSSSGYALDSYKDAGYSEGRAYFTGMDVEGSQGANFDLKFQVYEQEIILDEELSAAAPGVSESYNVTSSDGLISIPDSDQPFTFYPSGGVWENGNSVYTWGFSFYTATTLGPEITDSTGIYQFDVAIISVSTFTSYGLSLGLASVPSEDSVHDIGGLPNEYGYLSVNGNKITNDEKVAFGDSYGAGDTVRVVYDARVQTLDFYLKKNGEGDYTLQGSGHAFENVEPAAGKTLSLGASLQCSSSCSIELLETQVPEIELFGAEVNFGEVEAGIGQVDQEYIIKNTGAVPLTLSGSPMVSISGSDAADFSVISQPADTTIASGNSTTFVIRFTPVTEGAKTATVTILSDDEDEGTYTFNISGTGVKRTATLAGDEGWRLLASPVSDVSIGTLLDTLWTQGFPGADTESGSPNVYLWDAENRQWVAPSDTSYVPAAGTGFAVYVFGDDDYTESGDSTGFPKRLYIDAPENTGSVDVELFYSSSGTPADDGWNLIGNPYASTINWDAAEGWVKTNLDASIYVWSDSADGGNGQYLTWNGSTGTLPNGITAPWQGFWVKANDGDPSISFSEEVRITETESVLYKSRHSAQEKTVPELRFTLEEESGLTSTAIIMMKEEAATGKDRWDTYKLQPLNNRYLSLFSMAEDGSPLEINAIPGNLQEPLTLALAIESQQAVTQTMELNWSRIDIPEAITAILKDHHTGDEINLQETGSYRFQTVVDNQTKRSVDAPEAPAHPVLFAPIMQKTGSSISPRFSLTLLAANTVSGETNDGLPDFFALDQNYPNPFNPATVISYQLPVSSEVSLKVFDVLGREVATLIDGRVEAGYHQITFNARNLASGMYIYQLKAGSTVLTKKFTLIK